MDWMGVSLNNGATPSSFHSKALFLVRIPNAETLLSTYKDHLHGTHINIKIIKKKNYTSSKYTNITKLYGRHNIVGSSVFSFSICQACAYSF